MQIPMILGTVHARIQETKKDFVARQQYNHTNSLTENNHNFL